MKTDTKILRKTTLYLLETSKLEITEMTPVLSSKMGIYRKDIGSSCH